MNQIRLSLLIVLSLLLMMPVSSQAASCWQLLSSAKQQIRGYVGEVVATRGARLFVKPAATTNHTPLYQGFAEYEPIDPNAKRWRYWLGLKPFLYWLGHKITGQTDTRLTVMNGVWFNLVDRPTQWVTRAFSPPTFEPTLISKLPLIIGWALLTDAYIVEPVTDFAFNQKIQSEITRNQNLFDALINHDFRFRSVRDQLRRGQINHAEAERQAYMISQAYAHYYTFRDSKQGIFTSEDHVRLKNHFLFLHLKPVLDGIVKIPNGFRATAGYRETISKEQSDYLFEQTHVLYMKYQLAEVYAQTVSGKGTPAPDWLTPYIEQMLRDPFVALMTGEFSSGKVSQEELASYLMENYFWTYRLLTWASLGLVKINPETQDVVTLTDYQAEMLKDARARSRSIESAH